MEKKDIIKTLAIGLRLFIFAEILSFVYCRFIITFLAPGVGWWNSLQKFLAFSMYVIYWICHPASFLFKEVYISSASCLPMPIWAILEIALNLSFWICISWIFMNRKRIFTRK